MNYDVTHLKSGRKVTFQLRPNQTQVQLATAALIFTYGTHEEIVALKGKIADELLPVLIEYVRSLEKFYGRDIVV